MYLLLGQLVYTSFAGKGFSILASAQVPKSIQQTFIQRVVSQYWDSYNPPMLGYRAIYIHQLAPDQTLFGWLYNDGVDDIGRSHVPHFICYYLTESLLDFQLENIFTCLCNGPVALIDRHSLTVSLDTNVVPDLWSYQPVRPGVVIPSNIRKRNRIALQQGELLDLFVSIEEQEMVIEPSEQTYEQQMANLSAYTHVVIEGIGTSVAVTGKNPATNAIQPYQSYKQKLQRYGQALGQIIQSKSPHSHKTSNGLKRLPQDSRLRNKTVEPIKAWLDQHTKAVKYPVVGTMFPQNVSTVPSIDTHLVKSFDRISVIAYRNAQFLLKLGIAVTVLALATSIYGVLRHNSASTLNNLEQSAQTSRSVSYTTLAAVPNVPQGTFKYGGSTSFAPLRSKTIVSTITKAQPQFQLRYTESDANKPGSSTGIKMLLAGELSFTQSSRRLKNNEFSQAKERGFNLEQVPVAIDGIAFYVNPQVSISGLSLSQIKDIFTGKVTNWKALGGPDLPIAPFSRNPQVSGTVEFLQEKVLAGEKFGSNVQEVLNVTESLRKVAETSGGISYATASEVIKQKTVNSVPLSVVSPLPVSESAAQNYVSPFADVDKTAINKAAFTNGTYPLTRLIFVIIKRNGGIDEQAGSAYVKLLFTDEGQQLIEQAGFIPIR